MAKVIATYTSWTRFARKVDPSLGHSLLDFKDHLFRNFGIESWRITNEGNILISFVLDVQAIEWKIKHE